MNVRRRLRRATRALAGVAARTVGIRTTNTATERLAIAVWLDELRANLPPVKGHVAIVAMRNWSWFGWAVYAACWMRKLGYAPVLLYRGTDLDRITAAHTKGLLGWLSLAGFWDQVKQIPDIQLIDIDARPAPTAEEREGYSDFAETYAPTMAAYDLRLEENEEGEFRPKYEAAAAAAREALMEFGPRSEAILRDIQSRFGVKRLIGFSGLIGVTSALGEAARRVGMSVAFCEGWAVKRGHMIVRVDGPALDYNIRGWLQSVGQWDDRMAKEMEQFLAFQETSEVAGDAGDWLANYHRFQRSAANTQLAPDLRKFLEGDGPLLLLAPNCVGDSATLRVQTVFKSQREWIHAVCDHFRKHPDWRLVVRAHPDEQFYFERNKIVIMMGDVAERAAAGAPNIRVIKGSEDISTYALINQAKGGLIWMSTVGVDMTVRGCPVLAAAKPKYHGLGIVHEPTTREDYFATLDRIATAGRATSEEQKRMGKHYLSILAKEFSYDAFSPDYCGRDVRLEGHPKGGEFDTFYRVLAGELPSETRPPLRERESPSTT